MNSRPIKVLLVDDDEDDFILTRDLFSEIKTRIYEVDWASSYEKALEKIGQSEHDVYLFDYRLGGRSGLDLLKQAQQSGSNIPVIVLTGQSEQEVDIEAMYAGAEDYLVKKELTAKTLERAVRYAIERKRNEKQIQKLAAFPRWNPNPVLEFSATGELTYSNAAAQALATSLGKPFLTDILPPNVGQLVKECLASDGEKINLQTSIDDRTFGWQFIPIPLSHVVHGYATEITGRLNLETQLRHSMKMEAVGQLAAGVAHDFNNILTIIQGHADLLLHKIKADSQSEIPLKQICLAAERAGSLIRQLLMFSRKQVMQHTFLDLNEVVDRLTQMLRGFLGEHIAIETHSPEKLPLVYADTGMIEQVLMNLAVNARDAMPKGGRLVFSTSTVMFEKISALQNPEARPGQFVCLKVSDTGCGMDAETLHRIFEPFFTTKEVGKGTGLGLATVYGIVKQHYGWVEVESHKGAGSTFKIYLPATENKTAVKAKETSKPFAEGGNETILVVEDEPALRQLVVEILQIYGYQILQAESGVHALKIWKEHAGEIDLLLTDMVMPDGISGRELADLLLKENENLAIVYTSGYSPGMAGQDTALLAGFNFLPKPYPPSRLAEVIRLCLNNRAENPRSAVPKLPNKIILLVEDEPDLLDLIEELLMLDGYTVHKAKSADEAMEIWKNYSEKIDLLFTDITLPNGVTGDRLAEKLQGEKASLKIIFSSGHTEETLTGRFALPRNANLLRKPFLPAVLSQTVKKVLSS
ncbi:MAG: response regulator [Verrucomicrobiota bacterium]